MSQRKSEACQMKTQHIIDFHDGQNRISQNGIRIEKDDYDIITDYILVRHQHCIIRNFPDLIIRDANLDGCIFENCDEIEIDGGRIDHCIFRNIKTLFLAGVEIANSKFEDMSDEGFALMVQMQSSSISDSEFRNISLKKGGYLCQGDGDCSIRNCTFEDIEVADDAQELFCCSKRVHPYLCRVQEYDMVDRASCKGLK